MNASEYPSLFRKFYSFFGYFFLFLVVLCASLIFLRLEVENIWLVSSIVFFPLLSSIIFLYMGRTSGIFIKDDAFIVKLFTSTVIAFSDIQKLVFDKIFIGRYAVGSILVLYIHYGEGKKLKVHFMAFENYQDILKVLKQKTRKEFEITDAAREFIKERKISISVENLDRS